MDDPGFRELLEALPGASLTVDVKTMTVLAANKKARDAGVAPGERCWRAFRRHTLTMKHTIRALCGLDESVRCWFCRAADAVANGVPRRSSFDGSLCVLWLPIDDDVFVCYFFLPVRAGRVK